MAEAILYWTGFAFVVVAALGGVLLGLGWLRVYFTGGRWDVHPVQ